MLLPLCVLQNFVPLQCRCATSVGLLLNYWIIIRIIGLLLH